MGWNGRQSKENPLKKSQRFSGGEEKSVFLCQVRSFLILLDNFRIRKNGKQFFSRLMHLFTWPIHRSMTHNHIDVFVKPKPCDWMCEDYLVVTVLSADVLARFFVEGYSFLKSKMNLHRLLSLALLKGLMQAPILQDLLGSSSACQVFYDLLKTYIY